VLCVGRKGRDILRREYANLLGETIEGIGKPTLNFASAEGVSQKLLEMYAQGEFDVATIIYNKFKSAMSQIVTVQQLIPVPAPAIAANQNATKGPQAVYEFEPEPEDILTELLPRNLNVQIYRALLENNASEQGARMVAMDNATRNSGDMINKLNLNYNRARQAYITKEMIEIVSGAESV
jgi:F-type H+-transporting ATPase subunit gamma